MEKAGTNIKEVSSMYVVPRGAERIQNATITIRQSYHLAESTVNGEIELQI